LINAQKQTLFAQRISEWYMSRWQVASWQLYLRGLRVYISAFIWLKDSPADRSTIAATYSFSIYDEERERFIVPEIHSQIPQSFTSKQSWGMSKLAKNSVVLESKIFSVICKLEYEDSRTTTTSVLCGPSTQLNNEEANSSLDQNFEQLFTNRSDTDVCFVIDGKEIQAHKLVLSARSPVFAAMLKSGMKESVSNRVEIDDIAPDIFEALLRFIYTDRVDLTRIETKDLLAAANKYLLPLLKFECQQFLARRITAKNCVELLALADLHNAVHLKKSTATFVRLHRADIFQTEEWKNLRQSRPYLALDTIEGLI